jgi:hypothetical protein
MATLPSRLAGAIAYVTRAESRWPALFRARLERAGAPPVKVTLRNVSHSGFMAVSTEPVAPGSLVKVYPPIGKPVVAEVRWAFNNRFGASVHGRFETSQIAVLLAFGLINYLVSPSGIRFVVVTACIAMYLLA